jgi:hypothetical protein
MPEQGFLFPAFQDRNTDIHRLLYYSKNAKELCPDITEQLLGCVQPIPASQQKESFQTIIEDTLGEECVYDVVRNIHENLNEMIEEQKESGEPLELDKMQVRKLLERSGAPEENLEQFEKQYDEEIGAQMTVMANNISDTRKFEVKTPQMTVKVSPEQAGLVETRMIDGVPCLVIPLTDEVEVNGIHVHLKDEEVLKALEQSADEE